jgi:hypothetical protein
MGIREVTRGKEIMSLNLAEFGGNDEGHENRVDPRYGNIGSCLF